MKNRSVTFFSIVGILTTLLAACDESSNSNDNSMFEKTYNTYNDKTIYTEVKAPRSYVKEFRKASDGSTLIEFTFKLSDMSGARNKYVKPDNDYISITLKNSYVKKSELTLTPDLGTQKCRTLKKTDFRITEICAVI